MRVTLDEGAEGNCIGEVAELSFVDRPLEARAGQDRGEVEERPGNGRDPDAAMDGDLVGRQARTVKVDTSASVEAARRGDIDEGPQGAQNLPESTGGTMAQKRVRSAGQDGRHPTSLADDRPVTDRVDATVKLVEATVRDASVDRLATEAELEELAPRDRAVLSLRKGGDEAVGRFGARFASIIEVNCATNRHGRSLAAVASPLARQT